MDMLIIGAWSIGLCSTDDGLNTQTLKKHHQRFRGLLIVTFVVLLGAAMPNKAMAEYNLDQWQAVMPTQTQAVSQSSRFSHSTSNPPADHRQWQAVYPAATKSSYEKKAIVQSDSRDKPILPKSTQAQYNNRLLTQSRGAQSRPLSNPHSDWTVNRSASGKPDKRPSVETVKLDLFVGQVTVMEPVDITRVAIGNGAIVRAEVLKTGELLIIAENAGSTSLRLWHTDKRQTDYNIRVSQHDPETRVRQEKMVRLRVRMVEFRKSALSRLGINWADAVNGPGFAVAGDAVGNALFRPAAEGFAQLPNTVAPFSTYFGIASHISSRINLLAQNGDAVTLAEPVLSATNGGQASFLAGGEVPYPSVSAQGQPVVEFKEYGIKLLVAPLVDANGTVRARVETEISHLDSAVSIQGAPGLLTRRAQTEVNVRSGETIVISGLLSAENSKDIDRIPGIGRLPVIGRLFSSQNQRNAVSELVIFITPEVINPSLPSEIYRDGSGRNKQLQFSMRERQLYAKSGGLQRQARHQLQPAMD